MINVSDVIPGSHLLSTNNQLSRELRYFKWNCLYFFWFSISYVPMCEKYSREFNWFKTNNDYLFPNG